MASISNTFWRRETGEARLFSSRAAALVSRVSRLCCSTLARECTPLTKSEEKERLLAVYVDFKYFSKSSFLSNGPAKKQAEKQ